MWKNKIVGDRINLKKVIYNKQIYITFSIESISFLLSSTSLLLPSIFNILFQYFLPSKDIIQITNNEENLHKMRRDIQINDFSIFDIRGCNDTS